MKKKLVALLLCAALLLSTASGALAQDSQDVTKLVMMFMTWTGAPADTQAVQDAINAITVDKLGIEVELQISDVGAYKQAVQLALSGGEQVDIITTILLNYPSLVAQGYLTDLEENDLLNTYGAGPNYIVVRNLGRGTDFSQLDESSALQNAIALGAKVVSMAQLHEASMRKIDRQNASFWAAINTRSGPDVLGMLERQRIKTWLKSCYAMLDGLHLV